MRTDLQELRDAIRFGYATDHDLSTAKREDVIAIKRDPELVQYRFVAHKYSGDDTEDEEVISASLSPTTNSASGSFTSDEHSVLLQLLTQPNWTVGGSNSVITNTTLTLTITVEGSLSPCSGS